MDAALAKLFVSNAQWVKAILWLGCSDSRVPESVVTASRPGDIFVHRNIANQVHPDDDSVLSVITYAVAVVGVEHILVVGHTNCGGAAACFKAGIPDSEALTKIVEASVRAQVENVAATGPVKDAWAGGRKNLWVHGIVYELETGTLRDLAITRGPPAA
ncbi:carbonic anhydrase [Russula vinacea]|nr:carbonic anhydrase [Russula vinacea]